MLGGSRAEMGTIQVGLVTPENWTTSVRRLPDEPFSLCGVCLKNARADDIKRLSSCERLEFLKIEGVNKDAAHEVRNIEA